MNFENLRNTHQKLLTYMQDNGYSQPYINAVKGEIAHILRNTNQWTSYTDIYEKYACDSNKKEFLHSKKTIINVLAQFDLLGLYPDGRKKTSYFTKGAYYQLIPEYKELIDFYEISAKEQGKKDTTIHGEACNCSNFLLSLQNKGIYHLVDATEEVVIYQLVKENGEPAKSSSYIGQLTAVFKTGLDWKKDECKKMLYYLPKIRKHRKNIQYLTLDENKKFKDALKNFKNELYLRDRAIGNLLFYTGLRCCDIAGMTMNSINWERDLISLYQQKTGVLLELPLSALVGNSIYDYVISERGESDAPYLFLSRSRPYSALHTSGIEETVYKIFRVTGIRQNPEDLKGAHLFRHNLATSLLENGVSRPVISKTLGHVSPLSVDSYLSTDFPHLKECSLSIEKFPVSKEVFLNA